MRVLMALWIFCLAALFVLVGAFAFDSSPDRAAAKRAAAEAQASQAAAQAAQAQAALESARYAGQAQLALTQAQADALRTNSAMPMAVLFLGGIALIATPLTLLVALLVVRRTAPTPVSPPQVSMLPPAQPQQIVLLLPRPGQQRGEYLREIERLSRAEP